MKRECRDSTGKEWPLLPFGQEFTRGGVAFQRSKYEFKVNFFFRFAHEAHIYKKNVASSRVGNDYYDYQTFCLAFPEHSKNRLMLSIPNCTQLKFATMKNVERQHAGCKCILCENCVSQASLRNFKFLQNSALRTQTWSRCSSSQPRARDLDAVKHSL